MTGSEGQHVHWHHIDPEEAREVFAGATELTAHIVDQNDRYTEAQTLFEEDDEIREIVVRGIVGEQEDTQLALTELDEAHGSVYDQIGRASLSAITLVGSSQREIAGFEKDYEEKTEEINLRSEELKGTVNRDLEDKLARIRKLSPKAFEEAEAVLRGRSENSIAQDPLIKGLEAEAMEALECMEGEKRALEENKKGQLMVDELMHQGGNAWPVPLAMRGVAEYEAAQQAHLDQMPVEPTMSASAHRRMDELRSHHVDEPDASLYAVVYLIDRAGKTVTVDELAQTLYNDDVRQRFNEHTIRTRVTTILGPLRNHVAPIMLGEGYVLQYGIRVMLEKNAETTRVTGRRRIYRAVTIEEANNAVEGKVEQEGAGYVDTFTIEHVVAEQSHIAAPSEAADPTQLELVGAAPEQGGDVSAEAPSATAEIDADHWERDLKRTIGETLNMLEEKKLLDDINGTQLKHIRAKLGRRGRFTDRGLQRVQSANFLPDFKKTQADLYNEIVVTPQQMLQILLFNERSGPLRKDSRDRSAALEIIDKAVEAYFYNKEQQAKAQQKPDRHHQ